MFKRLRRRIAFYSIKSFLAEFLPKVGLGEVYLFECVDFRLGNYAVHTCKGKYKITFWEFCDSAKEFKLELNYNGGEGEFLIFSIKGNLKFYITPKTLTIDRNGERQVVDLILGYAKVYPKVKEDEGVNYMLIEYKKPPMKSKYIDMDLLLRESFGYL